MTERSNLAIVDGNGPAGRFELLNDSPSRREPDPLGYDAIARSLARAVTKSRSSTPLVLGIEGEWGSGKSSLMQRLQAELDADPQVTTIWFNAWTAERASALEGLVKSVLEAIDPSFVRRALRNKKIIGYARAIALVLSSRIGLTSLVNSAWDQVTADARTRNELRGLMEDAIGRWRDRHAEVGPSRTLVLFIDDLDRASPSQIFEVFEALKLYLDLSGLVFIVGYDRNVISRLIVDQEAPAHGPPLVAAEYLEKIIQVSFHVPPPNDEQSAGLFDRYTHDSGTTELFDEASRAMVVERSQRNPRRMKRFINAFVLTHSLDSDWNLLGAKNLVAVLLLESHFPEFLALFRARTGSDPITEFLAYRSAKVDILTRGGSNADSARDREKTERIQQLEHNLPESYPLLFEDDDFVAIAEAMRASGQWESVRAKLGRRSTQAPTVPAEVDVETLTEAMADRSSTPGTVLWIDDRPEANRTIADALEREGWLVVQVNDGAAARRVLATRRFDVLVSDLERYGNQDAGFEDLASLRDDGLHSGLAIFFVLRVTPERRERAEALQAIITNKVETLLKEMHRFGLADEQTQSRGGST